MTAVQNALRSAGAKRVLDLGCGEGRLLRQLITDQFFDEIVGVDTSMAALIRARQKLDMDRMPPAQRSRLRLLHGSLTYRDKRLAGFDGAAVVEVVEHLDPERLNAFERSVFEFSKSSVVVLTTPNADYNVRFGLPAGSFRHPDHRFEWPREDFERWAGAVAERFGYAVTFEGIGPDDSDLGRPTQMAVFRR
jgi:3' terminal RNA ribose 2'-O-methyltransferase Hen1